jgi:hypothetical protein
MPPPLISTPERYEMKFVLSFHQVASNMLNNPFQSRNPVEEDTLKLVETDRHPTLCQGVKQGRGVQKSPVLQCALRTSKKPEVTWTDDRRIRRMRESWLLQFLIFRSIFPIETAALWTLKFSMWLDMCFVSRYPSWLLHATWRSPRISVMKYSALYFGPRSHCARFTNWVPVKNNVNSQDCAGNRNDLWKLPRLMKEYRSIELKYAHSPKTEVLEPTSMSISRDSRRNWNRPRKWFQLIKEDKSIDAMNRQDMDVHQESKFSTWIWTPSAKDSGSHWNRSCKWFQLLKERKYLEGKTLAMRRKAKDWESAIAKRWYWDKLSLSGSLVELTGHYTCSSNLSIGALRFSFVSPDCDVDRYVSHLSQKVPTIDVHRHEG